MTQPEKGKRKYLAWALLDAVDLPRELLFATNHAGETPLNLSAKVAKQQLLDVRTDLEPSVLLTCIWALSYNVSI